MRHVGDRYSVVIPYKSGVNLNYYIIARDGAGNEAPVRGYITRGAGLRLGIPKDIFMQVKTYTGGAVAPARPGLIRCEGHFCGDPVNTQTGNLFEQIRIAQLPGRPEITLDISYNSQGGGLSIFGESWVHSYNSHIMEMDNADFQGEFVQYPDGKAAIFSGPDFTPETGVYDILEKQGDGFKLTKKDKTVLYFDSYGDLSRMEDANGNGLTFTYSEQIEFVNFSKLASIKADGGREMIFEYNENGLVSQVNLPEGKIIQFEYNDTDDLVKIINGKGEATIYEYEDHSITKKLSPEGHAYYENSYDDQRRVVKQIAGTS